MILRRRLHKNPPFNYPEENTRRMHYSIDKSTIFNPALFPSRNSAGEKRVNAPSVVLAAILFAIYWPTEINLLCYGGTLRGIVSRFFAQTNTLCNDKKFLYEIPTLIYSRITELAH